MSHTRKPSMLPVHGTHLLPDTEDKLVTNQFASMHPFDNIVYSRSQSALPFLEETCWRIHITSCDFGVCLQGPTSSGKTSLVAYLASRTGHRCIRINNHESTDLQEYLGSYISDEQGRLVFKEGALVTALREGHWVVLDELNLAPSEVLEALNR